MKWLVVALALAVVACGPKTAATKDSETVNQQQNAYQVNQPVPRFDYSLERDTVIQLYQARNQALATYTVIVSDGTGDALFACPSIGFPIQADVQLTNPQMPYRWSETSSPTFSVDQPEPNGLYSSKATDGTWVRCVGPDGRTYPVYSEGKVLTFPFVVKYDQSQHLFIPAENAKPSLTLEQKPR